MWTKNKAAKRGAPILATFAALAVVFAAMAYAFAGGLGLVSINSDPSGAKVIVGGQVIGTTPAEFKMPSGSEIRVTIKKDGFKTRSFKVTPAEGKTKKVKIKLKALD